MPDFTYPDDEYTRSVRGRNYARVIYDEALRLHGPKYPTSQVADNNKSSAARATWSNSSNKELPKKTTEREKRL